MNIDEYTDSIIAFMFLLSPTSIVQFLLWKCIYVFFIRYINGNIIKNELKLKILQFVAITIIKKYRIKNLQEILINFDGGKTTPNVFKPASLSPLISFKSFKKTAAMPKQRNINDSTNPFKNESEKISQILMVYAGYAIP